MELTLKADFREKSKKSDLSRFRRDHLIPGVVYGSKKDPIKVVVAERELVRLTQAGGANAIIHLRMPHGEDTVILKALQRHVVTHQPIHADFQRISMTAKIEVKVPLHVVGEAPGVKTGGGVLEHILRELKIRALPGNIPQRVDADVTQLQLNESLYVKDLVIPEGVEVLDAPDHLVLNVVQPTVEEAPAPVEGAPAAAEPEVIAKGKKEEEGTEAAGAKPEGKAEAKPAAKAEAKHGPKAEAKPEAKK